MSTRELNDDQLKGVMGGSKPIDNLEVLSKGDKSLKKSVAEAIKPNKMKAGIVAQGGDGGI